MTDLPSIAAKLYSRSIAIVELETPDFGAAEWLSSWEWYVVPELRAAWPDLSTEAKWVACIGAITLWRRENEIAI